MSIRARLILLVLAVMLPALAAAVWLIATAVAAARDAPTPPGGWVGALLDGHDTVLLVPGAALLLILLALGGAVWMARRISHPLKQLQLAARQLQHGRRVERAATGVAECDDVLATLAEASETIRHARGDLEQQVEQAVLRTREAEQRASQGQRIEALGRLTGGVAHDFNNLLGVVSNSAYLIQRQVPEGEHGAALAAILRAVEAGHGLTQHLLRFAGRKPVRPQPVDLRHYLLAQEELMSTVLGSRIRFSAQVALNTAPVTVDSAELELALINLALNARDAMPRGGEVQLAARNARADELDPAADEGGTDVDGYGERGEDGAGGSEVGSEGGSAMPPVLPAPAGPQVLITFDDGGCGFDEDTARHVFEPFFTTKGVGKGSGLGLAQVRGFCVQAGGSVRLASTPGLGTTVMLLLPASRGPALATPALTAPAQPIAAGALSGKQLLLVDDNEDLGRVTADLLGSFGCSVTCVTGAAEALQAVDPQTFDAVLSDVVMPGAMDGVALARELRRRWPQLPVLLVSGYAGVAVGSQEFELLSKPCAPDELVAALQRVMLASVRPAAAGAGSAPQPTGMPSADSACGSTRADHSHERN